jgi:hypothetical protein
MTTTLLRLLTAAAFGAFLNVATAHEIPDPKFGGVVAVARHIDFELVSQGDTVTIYVEDHGEAVPTEGGHAKLTVIEGSVRRETDLSPVAPNRFIGKGPKPQPGAEVVAAVTLPGPRVITVRFMVK